MAKGYDPDGDRQDFVAGSLATPSTTTTPTPTSSPVDDVLAALHRLMAQEMASDEEVRFHRIKALCDISERVGSMFGYRVQDADPRARHIIEATGLGPDYIGDGLPLVRRLPHAGETDLHELMQQAMATVKESKKRVVRPVVELRDLVELRDAFVAAGDAARATIINGRIDAAMAALASNPEEG